MTVTGARVLLSAVVCLLLTACGREAPTQAQCEAAAVNLVEVFAADHADDPIVRRVAAKQRRAFLKSCVETGSAAQAACASEASSVAELEQCR